KTCRVAFHPRSKARNTALRACSSGAFTLPLSFGNSPINRMLNIKEKIRDRI
ncbi:hypothetical protein H6G66_28860, partial [Fischerella sp. FACHB-380]|nr:hypothetical protein [Fischerella sp. FACHB-380]